jgi:hypothetical protein
MSLYVRVMNVRRGRVKEKPSVGISLLLLKSSKGTTRINVPICLTNHYLQYICSQNICTARICDLTQVYLELKLTIMILLYDYS